MNKTYIKYFLSASLFLILFSSCLVEPKYPIEPKITFKSFSLIRTDTLVFTFDFRDGDGDLGLNQPDQEDPKFGVFLYFINQTTGKRDSIVNPDFYNIFMTYYAKNADGEFEEIEIPDALVLDGRFPRLIDDQKAKPIEGSITYYQKTQSSGFKDLISNKTIKIKARIKDRALHESNEIESDTLVIPKL